jgi:hypothetical protein
MNNPFRRGDNNINKYWYHLTNTVRDNNNKAKATDNNRSKVHLSHREDSNNNRPKAHLLHRVDNNNNNRHKAHLSRRVDNNNNNQYMKLTTTHTMSTPQRTTTIMLRTINRSSKKTRTNRETRTRKRMTKKRNSSNRHNKQDTPGANVTIDTDAIQPGVATQDHNLQ